MRRVFALLRRGVRWLGRPSDYHVSARCPVCHRPITVTPNRLPPPGLRVPRFIGELLAACEQQHATAHSENEVQEVIARRGEWI